VLKGKFKVADGGKLVLLGLTEKNLAQLQRGLPIAINAEKDFDVKGLRILMAYGKDEAEIKQWLVRYIESMDPQAARQLLELPDPN